MQYVRYENIKRDSYDIPDGHIFTVYRNSDSTWALAMRVGNQFTLTKFFQTNVDERAAIEATKQAKKQITFCKTYGWSYTGRKGWNTAVDDMEHEFMCMYCKRITYDTSDPCPCRNKTREDLFIKTSKGGIILPI